MHDDGICFLKKIIQKHINSGNRKFIKSLHGKNSHGYDEISMKILKFGAPFSSCPIAI